MFSSRIKEHSEILNDTDHILINYILENEHRIKDLTIREVSEKNYVAYNTVVRFSKKLGYSGFSELKFLFGRNSEAELVVNEDTEDSDEGVKILQATNKLLTKSPLEQIAYKVYAAKEVFVYGVGDSEYYATVLSKNLTKVEKRIKVLERLYEVDNVIRDGSEETMIIFISAGGRTEEICNRARRTISKGIEVVSFTGDENSELATITSNNILFKYNLEVVHNENVSDLRGMHQAVMVFTKIYWDMFPVI